LWIEDCGLSIERQSPPVDSAFPSRSTINNPQSSRYGGNSMPPLPPLKDILEVFQLTVLPAASGAALVMCAFLGLARVLAGLGSVVGSVIPYFRSDSRFDSTDRPTFGQRVAPIASAAAIAFAFLWANFTLTNLKGPDQPTWANTTRLVPWVPEANAPGWHWLPRAGLLMVVVGVLSRWLGLITSYFLPERWWVANIVVWAPRIATVVIVSGWLTSGKANENVQWLWPAVAAAMLVIWVPLDGLANDEKGAESAGYLFAIFIVAAVVLLYAHSARFTELAVIISSGLFGVALIACMSNSDVSGAIPAGVAFLPGLLIAAGPSLAENKVPAASFWLIALAPVLLIPFLHPSLAAKESVAFRVLRFVLIVVPLVVAVVLASQHEKLAFDEAY
jgi:hypothetical protein